MTLKTSKQVKVKLTKSSFWKILASATLLSLLGCTSNPSQEQKQSDQTSNSIKEESPSVSILPEDLRTDLMEKLSNVRNYTQTGQFVVSSQPKILCLDTWKDWYEIRFWIELIYTEASKDSELNVHAIRTTDEIKSEYGADVGYLDPPGQLELLNGIDGSKTLYLTGYGNSSPIPCLEVEGSKRPNIYVSSQGTLNVEDSAVLRRTLAQPNTSVGFSYGTQRLHDANIGDSERKKMLAILALYDALNKYEFDPKSLFP